MATRWAILGAIVAVVVVWTGSGARGISRIAVTRPADTLTFEIRLNEARDVGHVWSRTASGHDDDTWMDGAAMRAIAVDESGIWVTHTPDHTVEQLNAETGVRNRLLGGLGQDARHTWRPRGTVSLNGLLWVADQGNKRILALGSNPIHAIPVRDELQELVSSGDSMIAAIYGSTGMRLWAVRPEANRVRPIKHVPAYRRITGLAIDDSGTVAIVSTGPFVDFFPIYGRPARTARIVAVDSHSARPTRRLAWPTAVTPGQSIGHWYVAIPGFLACLNAESHQIARSWTTFGVDIWRLARVSDGVVAYDMTSLELSRYRVPCP